MATLDELPLSTSAYLADTQHLDTAQHGAYLLLLMTMWRAGGWIDDDERKLAFICKCTVLKWRKLSQVVRPLLIEKDGKLSQKRLLVDAEVALRKISKNKSSGKLGGEAKSLKSRTQTLANATVSLENSEDAPPTSLFKDSEIPERKEGKEGGAGETKRPRRMTRAMVPDDWALSDRGQLYAASLGFSAEQIQYMRNNCVNYHRRTGKLVADLEAMWRNWCDNEVKFKRERATRGGTGRGGRVTFSDLAREIIDHDKPH